jgi:hypothetical protein
MPTQRHSFALEAADAELDAWLRSLANRSAVIRASLVEYRERPGQLARIEQHLEHIEAKVDRLLADPARRCGAVPQLALAAISDEDRETLMDLLRKYGTEG